MNILATEIKTVETVLYLAIADDGLRLRIQKELPQSYKCSCYKTIAELLKAIANKQPELILCHHDMLNDNNIALSSIKLITSARILLIGPPQDISEQIAVLKQGARGYFDTSSPLTKLNDALYSVLRGEVWIKRDVIAELIDGLAKPTVSEEQQSMIAQLTPKELDVAQQVSHGATNKMIAKQMNISERTVKAHLTAIFHKLNISDRLALAILFRDLR